MPYDRIRLTFLCLEPQREEVHHLDRICRGVLLPCVSSYILPSTQSDFGRLERLEQSHKFKHHDVYG